VRFFYQPSVDVLVGAFVLKILVVKLSARLAKKQEIYKLEIHEPTRFVYQW